MFAEENRTGNANVASAAIMMENTQTGQRYLRVRHLNAAGIPSSVITFLVVIFLGYGLMLVMGM